MIKTIPLIIAYVLSCAFVASQTPVRILPLGNSITQGTIDHYSYRFALWSKLKNDRAVFDFVGTLSSNYGGNPTFPDPSFDRNHEGHRGWRADQLLAQLPTWLGSYTPDLVLLHAGTNDVFMGNTTESTVTELKGIVDALRNDNPKVTIFLAKIIGTTASVNAGVIALNNRIDGIASEKTTTTSRIVVVDQYTGFNPSTDAYDGKHPNPAGEEKMAQKWFDAIQHELKTHDTQSPSIPNSLSASAITSTGFTLSWKASTDYVGVTGYEVFQDGVSLGITSGTTRTMTGLSASTQYAMTVRARDAAGNWSSKSLPLNVTTTGNSPTNGLTAEYFNTTDMTGNVIVKRVDGTINFDWAYGSPASGVNTNYFSVRWEGFIEAPVSGNYTFSTLSDDGVRMWVNENEIISNWVAHKLTTNYSQPVALVAGTKYAIKVEYYEGGGSAVIKTQWTYPGQAVQIIPANRLFLTNANTTDIQPPTAPTSLVASNITSSNVDLSWNASSDNIGVTGYEVLQNTVAIATPSSTTFKVTGLSSSTSYVFSVRAKDAADNVSNTSESITVTTKDQDSTTNAGTGLAAEYYNTKDLSGNIILKRVDPQINFEWAYASPGEGINTNYFSVRWTGDLEAPVSGNYAFTTISDDGIRLSVNGVQVINRWVDQKLTTVNGTPIALTSGQKYNIVLEYYEGGGAATAKLLWAYPGQTQQVVPATRLYPTSSTTTMNSMAALELPQELKVETKTELYPNPAKQDFYISLYSDDVAQVQINILSTTGQSVAMKETILEMGSNEVLVDVSGLHDGLYFIMIVRGIKQEQLKLLIAR